ncbi:phosphatidyl-myo-inositol dimannoside synthase [Methylomarinovum caldicuralii]|uniref:Phosphatidyl-myo-inositol dimannoside synthase n=1 Tax=Methylomarinovum caldicuralii TaxID=438856 RepID=A0AAU9CW02_9GAMM|nr:glycosyltransferase family 4 protein [Methylomarinovum caldicuralii]BCX82132.1 phosphatidyl-myo-inositol dimannoside synthase [Methylomarinovum caldicuralii]
MSLPRVGIVSPEFPPDIGGVENYALGYVRALAGMGYPVTVFTCRHPKGEIDLPGVDIRPVLKLRRVLDRKLLETPGIDAWHAMNAAYAWIAEETEKPVVVSVHGNDFLRAYQPVTAPALDRFGPLWRFESRLRPLERAWRGHTTRKLQKWLPKATAILTNSRYTERVLLGKIPACRGRTIPALVGGDPFFLELPLAGGERHSPVRLATVARLSEPRKNIHLVLEALARLQDRYDFRYTVVGDGHLRPELEGLAQKLRLADRVKFAGSLERETLRRMLLESDLFVLTPSVLPHSHEGFGLVYLEAAACGVPSLAARLAGAAEAVAEGESGFFVEKPETEAIASALGAFLEGRIRYSRRRCREFAKRFTWEKVVQKALPFYAEKR